jgi:SAM-dependent methyltransferase
LAREGVEAFADDELKQLRPTYKVTGLDLSPDMLQLAAAKLPGVRLIEADMRAFDLEERFDVALCLFDSINHLLHFAEWKAVFARAHDHLNDGGIFIFDINTQRQLASFNARAKLRQVDRGPTRRPMSADRPPDEDKSSAAITRSYDVVADEYARMISDELAHKPLDRRLLDRFAAEVAGRGRVCDVGCGPGHVARYLYERGVDVFAIDLSPRMIELAAQLNPEIEFAVADVLALAVPRASWAGAVAFYSLIRPDPRRDPDRASRAQSQPAGGSATPGRLPRR